jgi:hypothetical protein
MTNPYESHKPPVGSGGLYLKLEDGQTVTLRLASEPYIFQSEYQGKWSTRYVWVIYNFDEAIAQTLQLSPTTYKQIATLATDPEYGDPTNYNIKLKRNGTGMDTTYAVTASRQNTELTAEEREKVDKIVINDVKGFEHALPLSQVVDGNNAPKPGGITVRPAGKQNDVVLTDLPDDDINLDDIPF